jgi:hypothetical protein
MPRPINVSGKFIQVTPDNSLVHDTTREYLGIYLTAKIPVVIVNGTEQGRWKIPLVGYQGIPPLSNGSR